MENCKRLIIIAAALLAGCTGIKEQAPLQEPKTYGTLDVTLGAGPTKVSLQSGALGQTVVWDMEDSFRIYNVADATYTSVTPVSLSEDGFTATLPLPYPVGKDISVVVTFGGTEFRADSTVTAASPIEQTLRTTGWDCDAMPMASPILPLEKGKDLKVSLMPLGALVEVELTDLPRFRTDKMRNIHIETSAVRGTRSNQLTCDAYCYKVDVDGFSRELEDYMSQKYVFDGEYAAYLELSSPQYSSYTKQTKLYFLSPGFVQPEDDADGTILKSISVQITTDKNSISKSFESLDAKKVKFTAGRITRFSLDMATATVSERLGFSVEWSPGYLVYDAATKGYGFAGPEERGLYFKTGSLMGFDPFASTPAEEYFGHTKRFGAWQYDDAGNISYTSYYNTPWDEGTADLVAYRKDEAGDIVPFKPSSYYDLDYAAYEEGLTFDPAIHDPCSMVRDGKGWRLPTNEEALNLAAVINENLGNWRVWSLGSDKINTTDNLPHMIGITDKSGKEVIFSTTSTIDNANSYSDKNKIWSFYAELGYSESIYTLTSDWRVEMKNSGIGAVDASVLAITSLTSLRCNYECDPRTFYSNSANELRQSADMVRCVRDL